MRKSHIIIFIILIIMIIALAVNFLNESPSSVSLGSEDYGSVERLGPYGNPDSDIKIAYVVGLHPLESTVHNAFLNQFNETKDLNYCYYIYKINVTKDLSDYEQGRMNGQLLAQKYVLPDALDQNYTLVIDIHSMEVWSTWDSNEYMFCPVDGSRGEVLAKKILENCSFSEYYNPSQATGPPYLLTPLNQKGIPAICFEEFEGNSLSQINQHVKTLILTVDNLKFN